MLVVSPLPARLRRLAPDGLRDDVRLRSMGLGLGLIPPRTMHSEADARVLLEAAGGARRAVEIGVYEGASALALMDVLAPGGELHLIDPFGRRPDALPAGWAASEWATRRALARAQRRHGAEAPRVHWHVALSHEVAARWSGEVDLVFIDGDHSQEGCERDWLGWCPFVAVGGRVVFHDARAGTARRPGAPRPDGRGRQAVSRGRRGGLGDRGRGRPVGGGAQDEVTAPADLLNWSASQELQGFSRRLRVDGIAMCVVRSPADMMSSVLRGRDRPHVRQRPRLQHVAVSRDLFAES